MVTEKLSKQLILMSLIFTGLNGDTAVSGQGRGERRQQRIEESAKPQSIIGGETFKLTAGYESAYEGVLNYLKRRNHTIDSASKETGQIITSMTVTGGYNQTGSRVQATFIKDSERETTITVAVVEQKRKKLLQTEPWGDPKVSQEKSSLVANELKSALGSLASSPTPVARTSPAVSNQGRKSQNGLTNADIVDMLKAELPESTILLAIQKDPANLDTSAQALIQLKKQGATQKILDAVLQASADSGVPPSLSGPNQEILSQSGMATGVSLIDGPQRIQMKMSIPNTRAGTGGIFGAVNPFRKARVKHALNGNHAQLRTTNTSPIFEASLSVNVNPSDQIVVVKLNVKSDRREIDIGRSSLSGGFSTGIRKEDMMPISIEDLQTKGQFKLYRVKLVSPLPPGEYAVMYQSGSYDFGVDSTR